MVVLSFLMGVKAEFGPYTTPLINAFRIAALPEPGSLSLIAFGAVGLLLRRRR